MSKVTMYHNPKCSKCRKTLSLLEDKGVTVDVREYLKEAPSIEELRDISKKLQLRAKDFIRKKEDELKDLDLDRENDEALFAAINEHPRILERPIVIRGEKAVIGRPPENIEQLF